MTAAVRRRMSAVPERLHQRCLVSAGSHLAEAAWRVRDNTGVVRLGDLRPYHPAALVSGPSGSCRKAMYQQQTRASLGVWVLYHAR